MTTDAKQDLVGAVMMALAAALGAAACLSAGCAGGALPVEQPVMMMVEAEPNDTPPSADYIASAGLVSGSFADADDVDCYMVPPSTAPLLRDGSATLTVAGDIVCLQGIGAYTLAFVAP